MPSLIHRRRLFSVSPANDVELPGAGHTNLETCNALWISGQDGGGRVGLTCHRGTHKEATESAGPIEQEDGDRKEAYT
jgi:hypothetical protein